MSLSGCIDTFFAAAFRPQEWPEALDGLSRAAGANGATLVFGGATPGSTACSPDMAPFVREYFQVRQVADSREERVLPTLRQGLMPDYAFYRPDEIARDPYYQDFLKPRGYGWHGVALLADGPLPTVLSLKRSLRSGPFEATETAAFDQLLPYLRSAAGAAAAAHGAMARTQLDALAQAGLGALTLDRRGQVLEANGAVTLGDGLIVVAGEPRASHRADQPALEAAIARALRPERPSELPAPRRLALRRLSARRPLLVDVLPLIGAPELAFARAAALMVITDLDAALLPEIADLRQVFGLTAKEAELAARLAAGAPLEVVAEALHITLAHARQRLKVIFAKTDTHRQAELVALLSRLRGQRR